LRTRSSRETQEPFRSVPTRIHPCNNVPESPRILLILRSDGVFGNHRSYRKLIFWSVLVFLSIGWIVFYINTITKNSSDVLSPPLILFSGLSAGTFLLLLVLFWRHNRSAYKRRYSQWARSFFCQRCGTLTEQE
jgi:glucan phosphoethanolaminetransferase (alkaline phosphatase superfamily)